MSDVRWLVMLAGLLCAGAAHADERSAAAVDAFSKFCLPGPPDFAAIDAKATGMKLPVRKDVSAPAQPGQSAHSKSWLVTLDGGGSLELIAAESRRQASEASSCGIGVESIDGESVKQALVSALKLPSPTREGSSPDGAQRLTSWTYGDGMTLTLADGAPMRIPGLYLALIYHKDSSR